MRYFLCMFLFTVTVITACNNNKKTDPSAGIIPGDQKNYAGSGPLQLSLTVDGIAIPTDSARYTVNEFGGAEIEAWGERLTTGTDAYTCTLAIRLGGFHGSGDYTIPKELNTMFWQHKSYYVDAGHPGSILIDNWDDDRINGSFEINTDDGYGDRKLIKGTFHR